MYSQITSNKRRTWILLISMGSFTLALCALLGFSAGLDTVSALTLGGMFTATYALISYYWSDRIALSINHARAIQKNDAPDLYNLVENLCITQGQPLPAIYIINDPSPNAFATGRDPHHASLAFTSGLLALLNKQELEGVAAHELSHVANYDTRIMTIVVVLVGVVMLLSDMLLRTKFENDDHRASFILPFIGFALALLSPLFAQIIQLAISREREYLADASAALLTRYPEGLASALEKIQQAGQPLQHTSHATAHLFISSPLEASSKKTSWFKKLFSTHPPAEDRIARLRNMTL